MNNKYENSFLIITTFMAFAVHSELAAQECSQNIIQSTPNERFIIHDDGTVTDKNTDLMWMRCSLGQEWDGNSCIGDLSVALHTWRETLAIAEQETFANYSDWRLPNIKELESIIEVSCRNPAINKNVLLGTFTHRENSYGNKFPLMYWSSSIDANYKTIAWKVDFNRGSVLTQYDDVGGGNMAQITYPQAARLVRSTN